MSNKICVVLPCNIYTAPYYGRYLKIFNECNVGHDLIIWNRDQIDEDTTGQVISFNKKDVANSGDKKKIFKYFEFALFVKRKLEENKYDKVIFLSTSAATVALLSIFLKKNYKCKYWIDIRDYSFEWFKPYKFALSIAINNSYKSSISSEGFKRFLPDYDYIVTHNIDFPNIDLVKKSREKRCGETPIRISFIGNVRYFEENKKLLNLFKNDERFILQYYGTQSEKLKEYSENNNINNVDFHGRFTPNKTSEFYLNTHIINNVYGNGSMELTTALSNKLYFAASLHMPILVSPKTFMEEVTLKYGFGFSVDLEDSEITDKLYDWYKKIDKCNCAYDDFMINAVRQYDRFEQEIRYFINSETEGVHI